MNSVNLFPTVVSIFNEQKLANTLLPFAAKELQDTSLLTYQWDYKTTYTNDSKCTERKDLQFFTDVIKKNCDTFWNHLGFVPLEEWKVQVFFSEMFSGDCHIPHMHPNSKLSGVLYLKVPQNSSPIHFYDPRVHRRFTSREIQTPNEYNWEWASIPAIEGNMLIWESWIEHEVRKNKSTDGRITAVFNVW
jgi:uncharacterized protein (TIGR02466 family)